MKSLHVPNAGDTKPISASRAVSGVLRGRQYLADWRSQHLYPATNSKNFKRLAWEFLRRNPDYAAFAEWLRSLPSRYHTQLRPKRSDLVKYLCCVPQPAHDDETLAKYLKRCATLRIDPLVQTPIQFLRSHWGITYPLQSYENYTDRPKSRDTGRFRPLFLTATATLRMHPWLLTSGQSQSYAAKAYVIGVQRREVWAQFRLGEPIAPQLLLVSDALDKLQARELRLRKPVPKLDQTSAQKNNERKGGLKGKRVDEKSLVFALRTFDAFTSARIVHAHMSVGTSENAALADFWNQPILRKPNDEIAAKLVKHFRSECKRKSDAPVFRRSQILSWLELANSYILDRCYSRVAAHKSSTEEERERKREWWALRPNTVES